MKLFAIMKLNSVFRGGGARQVSHIIRSVNNSCFNNRLSRQNSVFCFLCVQIDGLAQLVWLFPTCDKQRDACLLVLCAVVSICCPLICCITEFLLESKIPCRSERQRNVGRSRLCDVYEHRRRTMWTYRRFLFFPAVITKGEWSRKQTKKQENAHKKVMSKKIGRAHQQLAGLFCFCFKAFFHFFKEILLFSIHIHRILWSCKDRCKWSGLCKPTHLIDADAINKSTRTPLWLFRSVPPPVFRIPAAQETHPSFLLKVLEQSEIAQHSTAADCVFFSIGIP